MKHAPKPGRPSAETGADVESSRAQYTSQLCFRGAWGMGHIDVMLQQGCSRQQRLRRTLRHVAGSPGPMILKPCSSSTVTLANPWPTKLWQPTAAGRTGHSSGALATLVHREDHSSQHLYNLLKDSQKLTTQPITGTKTVAMIRIRLSPPAASCRQGHDIAGICVKTSGLPAQARARKDTDESTELRSEQVRPQHKRKPVCWLLVAWLSGMLASCWQ